MNMRVAFILLFYMGFVASHGSLFSMKGAEHGKDRALCKANKTVSQVCGVSKPGKTKGMKRIFYPGVIYKGVLYGVTPEQGVFAASTAKLKNDKEWKKMKQYIKEREIHARKGYLFHPTVKEKNYQVGFVVVGDKLLLAKCKKRHIYFFCNDNKCPKFVDTAQLMQNDAGLQYAKQERKLYCPVCPSFAKIACLSVLTAITAAVIFLSQ